jgi:hypothetical protein
MAPKTSSSTSKILAAVQKDTGVEDTLMALISYLKSANSRPQLQERLQYIAPLARELPDEERDDLRESARTFLAEVGNRIKTDRLNGQIVTLTKRPRFVDTRFGGTFILYGKFSTDEEFESWMPGSEGGQTFRFFATRNQDDLYPMRVRFAKSPHQWKDADGGLHDGSIWRVERVPDAAEGYSEVPW